MAITSKIPLGAWGCIIAALCFFLFAYWKSNRTGYEILSTTISGGVTKYQVTHWHKGQVLTPIDKYSDYLYHPDRKDEFKDSITAIAEKRYRNYVRQRKIMKQYKELKE